MKTCFFTIIFSANFLFSSCEKDFKETGVSLNNQFSTARIAAKPNIIFILGDDIGYEIPTVNGGQSYATPNIDQLAQQGMRFTQCHSAPHCAPSRFMLLTGKYNFRNYTAWGQMDINQKTIGNMLKDAGHATCYAGKWQLDGGDTSIKTFGFDRYSVWLPYYICPENISRYKGAKIYQDGLYLPDSITNNKYSEDEVADYILNFIDSNQATPFFVYYSMILCHQPFSPTPDDPEYATWNDPLKSDKKFFPSMVKYMDKKIGLIISKLDSLGISNNTLIFYVGDNGTPTQITSLFDGKKVVGGKTTTLETGIHVPLMCKWPGKIPEATVNKDLIDFTDFLPTLADIAGIPVPTNYGILDGRSFYPQLTGATGTPRSSIFTHWENFWCTNPYVLKRYAQDSVFKLYETGGFYRFKNDLNEKKPLPDSTLTRKQKQIKQNLQNVINSMHN